MSLNQLQFNLSMAEEACLTCGITFCVPRGYQDQKIKDKTAIHCPNGHLQYYVGETDKKKLERLRKEIEAKSRRLEWKEGELQTEKKRSAAFQGQKTRMEKRIRAGLCPLCRRNFANLKSHMDEKHFQGKKK